LKGKPPSYRQAIADAVHRAMVETIDVLPNDRFQIITEHDEGTLIYEPNDPKAQRTDALVIIQITLNAGRTVEMKRSFYQRVAELLAQDPGLRKEDVFIGLVEVDKENWFVMSV
jgi:4-oxalocrotonate tautomerase